MRRVSIPIAEGDESMSSSGANNPRIPAPFTRRNGHDHAIQASQNNNGWSRPSFVPRPPIHHQSDERGGMHDHQWSQFEDRVRTGPFGLNRGTVSFPSQPHSLVRILILDEGLAHAMNPSLEQFIREPPPRVMGHWTMGFNPTEEEPGLTREEYRKAMSRLRKHIFSPTYPRRRAWKASLFSRGRSNTTSQAEKEDEDIDEGRECTICLDAFVPNQEVVLTPCNHMFHGECLVPWVKSHGKCPVCRYALVERRENAMSAYNGNNIINPNNEVMQIIALIRAMDEAFQWITNDDR